MCNGLAAAARRTRAARGPTPGISIAAEPDDVALDGFVRGQRNTLTRYRRDSRVGAVEDVDAAVDDIDRFHDRARRDNAAAQVLRSLELTQELLRCDERAPMTKGISSLAVGKALGDLTV